MVTSRDVAAHAGVSRATVSAVLSGQCERYRIGPETAAKVEAAASALGYVSRQAGRSLATGVAGAIGVVGCAAADWLIDGVHAALSRGLRARGTYAVRAGASAGSPLIRCPDERLLPLAAAIHEARAGRYDGLVVVCGTDHHLQSAAARLLDVLPAHEVVLIGETPADGFPAIRLDLERGLTALAVHLHSLGHHRLLLIDDGSWGLDAAGQRWIDTLASNGLQVDHLPVENQVLADARFATADTILASSLELARSAACSLIARGQQIPTSVGLACIGSGDAQVPGPFASIDPLLVRAGEQAAALLAAAKQDRAPVTLRSRFVAAPSLAPRSRRRAT